MAFLVKDVAVDMTFTYQDFWEERSFAGIALNQWLLRSFSIYEMKRLGKKQKQTNM